MPPPQLPRHRVLLVEDDPMVQETIALMLDDDYVVLVAGSVSAALAHLQSSDPPSIDVMLLDCLLPDGKISDVLTSADKWAIPVVLISGDPRQAEAAGTARRFLPKPFSHAALLSVLDSARR